MQYQHIGHKIKGFYKIASYGLKHGADMKQQEEAKKLEILKFWDKHGLEATIDAFGVKRRTLFLWKKKHKEGGGSSIGLRNASRRPKTVRKRQYPEALIEEIRRLRKAHHNIGKEKLHLLLNPFCRALKIKLPAAKTIGRIIADAPDKMRAAPTKLTPKGMVAPRSYHKRKRTYKPKGFKAEYPGHCVAFDSVERFLNGTKRYIVTCIDLHSRFAFAWCVRNHSALAAQEFFNLVKIVFPIPIDYVLTDCGSEFQKEFDQAIRAAHKDHWHSYPRTPKMNAHDERFNRTIQEEFVDYHLEDLLEPHVFNDKLIDYLLWYNGQRPHWGINLLSPIQFLVNNYNKCNMLWPHTQN